MPHQCLGCGFAFEEGSSALLAGCPKCKGTKFFYSARPVDEAGRKELQANAQNDLRAVVQSVLEETSPTVARELEADDGWAELTPKQLRRIVRRVQEDQKQTDRPKTASPPPSSSPAAPLPPAANDASVDSPQRLKEARLARDAILREFAEAEEESHPDTVTIEGEGRYGLDVKSLLERDPIVVHKDGAYMIHLPSLFDTGKKK